MCPVAEPRRTQAERREATRAKLLEAGRRLFAERGYEAVGSPELVAEAGVTRGALYHHFDGKKGLFAAVYESIEEEIVASFPFERMAAGDAFAVLHAGIGEFLELSLDAGIQQIALIDAPSVLGWEAWHEVQRRYGLGIIEAGLTAAIEAGQIKALPVRALADALLGALIEAALSVARSEDPRAAIADSKVVLEALLEGLRA